MTPEVRAKIEEVWDTFFRDVEKHFAFVEANNPLHQLSADGKHTWFELLKELDKTRDPSLLLPLLNVPDDVREHFKQVLSAHRMIRRHGQGRTKFGYIASTEKEIRVHLAAEFVRYLRDAGVSKNDRDEFIREFDVAPELFRPKKGGESTFVGLVQEAVNEGKLPSSERNRRARRRTRDNPTHKERTAR